MASAEPAYLSTFFPRPKVFLEKNGQSDLALDVRLITSNVLPLQRKAIRSILTASGVHVVANKKKYLVDARVEPAETFDLKKVPADAKKEYYEVSVNGSEIIIRAPEQEGTVWGVQTVATIFRLFQQGVMLPNLEIHDWPSIPHRGVCLKCGAMSDRMTLSEWMQFIDTLSAMKMNFAGIELFSNVPSDRLNIPVPEHEDWNTIRHVSWYSAISDIYGSDDSAPYLRATEDLFAQVVAYGEEKGVHILPVFDPLSGCNFLARKVAAYSAKDASGKATGIGICPSSKEGKTFFASLLENTWNLFFPDGIDAVVLSLGSDVPICKCKSCKGKKKEQLHQEYLLWLIPLLLEKGIRHILLQNNGELDAAFQKKLSKWKGQVVLSWNQPSDWKSAAWKKSPLPACTSLPMQVALPNEERLNAVETMVRAAQKGGCQAVSCGMLFRPQHLEAEALMAEIAWSATTQKTTEIRKRWMTLLFDAYANQVLNISKNLGTVLASPAYLRCLPEEDQWKNYPEAALLLHEKAKNGTAELAQTLELAQKSEAALQKLLALPEMEKLDRSQFQILLAEANAACSVASAFLCMLDLRKQLKAGAIPKKIADKADAERTVLKKYLEGVERNAPLWMTPCLLHRGAALCRFLDQLQTDLKSRSSKKDADKISWKLKESRN